MDGQGKPFTSALRRFLGRIVILCVFLLGLYVVYAGVLYFQYSSAYAKWISRKIEAYSISVISNNSGFSSSSVQSQTVQAGQVVQGYNPFDKPVIDWAFEHARVCVSAWI